jgi:DNA repair/transcription protein MET18/MMS19
VENVNMKAYTQAVRHLVYQLFDSLLDRHRSGEFQKPRAQLTSAFKDMGDEFISSYAKMVDGEKDPRNLMLLFQLDYIILSEFNVQARIEVSTREPSPADIVQDMFDITFCYFPIAFRPPPNDPYGITADNLKLALRKCLSASPHFAKMALPLFLEKYPTSSGPAMVSSFTFSSLTFPEGPASDDDGLSSRVPPRGGCGAWRGTLGLSEDRGGYYPPPKKS